MDIYSEETDKTQLLFLLIFVERTFKAPFPNSSIYKLKKVCISKNGFQVLEKIQTENLHHKGRRENPKFSPKWKSGACYHRCWNLHLAVCILKRSFIFSSVSGDCGLLLYFKDVMKYIILVVPGWLVKHPSLDFDTGHDTTVHEIEPCIGLCTDSSERAWGSLKGNKH